MADTLLIALGAANIILIIVVILWNGDKLLAGLAWTSAVVGIVAGSPAIQVLYGGAIIYLLISVRRLQPDARNAAAHPAIVPYFDEHDRQIGWVRVPPKTAPRDIQYPPPTQNTANNAPVESNSPGSFYISSFERVAHLLQVLPPPTPSTASEAPTLEAPPPRATLINSSHIEPSAWDGWPDGHIECVFPIEHLGSSPQLPIFWTCRRSTSSRGSKTAVSPEKGKEISSICLGALTCTSSACVGGYVIAPEGNQSGIERQLKVHCVCGSPFRHVQCSVKCTAKIYSGGVRMRNFGTHAHGKYSHVLDVPAKKGAPTLLAFSAELPGPGFVEHDAHTAETGEADAAAPTAVAGRGDSYTTEIGRAPTPEQTEPAVGEDTEFEALEQLEMDGDPDADT
ncbi:hypothetical protein MKEN_01239700 [Mycena kentingensis (nom. inval.)]|nr:hypothetical protein MKEN_01239700 [Mycena kentingensis (nom. inval.)]